MKSRALDRMMNAARAEGIVFTDAGEPLFQRDVARWQEIKATPQQRTAAEIEDDAAWEAASAKRGAAHGE